MVQGADRPGQPNSGQPSIFGNSGPSFAQMPSFTPVTRGAPQTAAPAQPAAPQATPTAFAPPPQTFADPPVQAPQPPAFPGVQPAQAQPQPQAQPQAYAAPTVPETAPSSGEMPDLGAADPGFPDSIFGDVSLGTGLEQQTSPLMEEPLADVAMPEAGASFPDIAANPDLTMPSAAPAQAPAAAASAYQTAPMPLDAAPTTTEAYGAEVAAAPQAEAYAQQQPEAYAPQQPEAYAPQQPEAYAPQQPEAYAPQQPGAYAQQQPGAYAPQQPEAYAPQQPEAYAPQQPEAYVGQPMPGAQDPNMYAQPSVHQGVPYGDVPAANPGQQLQTVDPNYGQPPQIPLNDPRANMQGAPQEFVDAGGDADFVDASAAADAGLKSKVMGTLKGRSAVMVASALLGAIALGGALAYAYKQSGGVIGSGDAPVVTADASPVKAAPDSPGGKEFPHKNKLIYDRLSNGATPESERLVPRQEDVAVPALPPAAATAGLPAAVATAGPAAAEGGPRKVQTMVVNPDGSVEAPAAAAAVAAAASQAGGAVAQPSMMPVPANQQPAAASQQVAAAAPAAAAPAAAASSYVVQLGSSKSQTDALANFADAQQKYPSLLSSYQPLVRKTDLGPKGTWYRLQVGPMADKDAAYRLCGQLKSKGHGDCLVMAQ